ncbi:MAG: translation initiation factor IF-2 subunit beta [Candidatus Bathyarchaeota archaeon]|jgi:translation initiation factor 2 subunit 2|nr:translation initiation factor IF-2 subunit beta [Candidatus Bathyarchaeota archaeon]UCC28170.1 MAG: translation initiation factor IF-2 subunit beta [Candidatus Bathyarchaeota archaeon]UCD40364.1 MAG: translation initiation factor IF-2 subunit beta [Candidatus Bathyarchaeota archaeon]
MRFDYNELLERARSQLPPDVSERKRFEVPKPRSITIGMKTFVQNFKEICDALNRDPQHLLRYLSREMATAGTLSGSRAVFQGRFRYDTIERLIQHYTVVFVTCPVCKRPDTRIVKEKRLSFMVCEACGARSSVRSM